MDLGAASEFSNVTITGGQIILEFTVSEFMIGTDAVITISVQEDFDPNLNPDPKFITKTIGFTFK